MGDMVVIDEQIFTDIADAIRDRNGEEITYKPREMAEAVENLHNVRPKKWTRPSDWPDYSKVDLTDQEVIYLTYDCSYENNRLCSILVKSSYTVTRGQIDNNGNFIASANPNNVNDGSYFREVLPTNEGKYVVYKIEPQSGHHITRFFFGMATDSEASAQISSWMNLCVERYCRIPNWAGMSGRSANNATWSVRTLIADTIMDASPSDLANFYNDGGPCLEMVDMSTCSFKNVTSMQNAFYNQYNLSECHLPHDLSNKCTNLNGCFNNCYQLSCLDLSGWDTSKVTNFASMFYNCNEIVEIKGLEDFILTSATTLQNFLYGVEMLRYLDTSKWSTTSVLVTLSGCFYNMFQVDSLDVSGFDTSNVTSFSSCFGGCRNIKTIDISSWIISNKTTNLSYMFGYARKLKNIIRTKNWDTSNVTDFNSMFRECKNIQEIDLSDFDFSKATSVRYMFTQCNSLRKLKGTFNFSLITNKTNVTDFATQCWQLEDISEMSITNSTYMPGFGYDYSIFHFRVPVVTNLADNCLRDMNHVRYFDFRDYTSVPALGAYTDINNGKNTKMKIIVPDNLYDTWIAATNWSNTNIKSHIINASTYESTNIETLDLTQCDWQKNSSYSESATTGTSYANMTVNGTGNRITSGLIDVPSATVLTVTFNDGYQCGYTGYDANGLYTHDYLNWSTTSFSINTGTIKKIALFIRIGDGTSVLSPTDWQNSGIAIKYVA